MSFRICSLAVLASASFVWSAPSAAADRAVWREPVTALAFVEVPKGCYPMGTPEGAFDDQDPVFQRRVADTERPVHEVCVDTFWITATEVTHEAWIALMGSAKAHASPRKPVVSIDWHEAQAFADRLTQRGDGNWRYRLPTEAEWEFACRAGRPPTTTIVGTDDLNPLAWYSSRYDLPSAALRHTSVQPVATRQPNAWDLYDMLGNTWEWTQDSYADAAYRKHALYNPITRNDSSLRTLRGGSFRSDKRWIRCEARSAMDESSRHDAVGFRLVRVPKKGN